MDKANLKIAVAQLNFVLGDVSGNAVMLRDAAARAQASGADILVTPELALCGYPPEDLLLRPDFYRACAKELGALATASVGIDILVGHPCEIDGERFNAASLLRNGKILTTYLKHRLPNYEVFDEVRYFASGKSPV